MPTTTESFQAAVIESLVAQHPTTGAQLAYFSYLDLPEDIRSADEMPADGSTRTITRRANGIALARGR
jgi:hypothetical protein